jgi:hypothetical protein
VNTVSDLFEPIDYPEPNSQAEIDNAVKKYPLLQRDFVWIGIIPEYRKEINKRWGVVKGFCEKNFVQEFRSTGKFYSNLWELNLRYLLLNKLTRRAVAGEPDLITNKYVVECVVPLPIDVPELKLDGKLYDFPTNEIYRRISTSLNSKQEQLMKRRQRKQRGIDYDTTPYIIALCLPESNYMGAGGKSGLNMVEEVLMGAKEVQVKVNLDTKRAITSIAPLGTITSSQDKEIEVAYFQRDRWKPVAAVIWCTEYLPKASDLRIVFNPNAAVPLSPKDIPEIQNIATYKKTKIGYDRDQKIR